jgi:hypothetical protein
MNNEQIVPSQGNILVADALNFCLLSRVQEETI